PAADPMLVVLHRFLPFRSCGDRAAAPPPPAIPFRSGSLCCRRPARTPWAVLLGVAAAFPLPARGERDRVRGNLELRCEHLQHAIEVAENLVVPDANNPVPKRIEVCVPAPIGCAIDMLSAIDLDDELLLAAYKVGVIRPKRLLPGKLQSAETPVAKRQPQDPFGPRAAPPQR